MGQQTLDILLPLLLLPSNCDSSWAILRAEEAALFSAVRLDSLGCRLVETVMAGMVSGAANSARRVRITNVAMADFRFIVAVNCCLDESYSIIAIISLSTRSSGQNAYRF